MLLLRVAEGDADDVGVDRPQLVDDSRVHRPVGGDHRGRTDDHVDAGCPRSTSAARPATPGAPPNKHSRQPACAARRARAGTRSAPAVRSRIGVRTNRAPQTMPMPSGIDRSVARMISRSRSSAAALTTKSTLTVAIWCTRPVRRPSDTIVAMTSSDSSIVMSSIGVPSRTAAGRTVTP